MKEHKKALEDAVMKHESDSLFALQFQTLKKRTLKHIQSIYTQCLSHLSRILQVDNPYNQLKYPYWTHLHEFATIYAGKRPEIDAKEVEHLNMHEAFELTLKHIHKLPQNTITELRNQLARSRLFHEYVRNETDPKIKAILTKSPLTKADVLKLRQMVKDENFHREWISPLLSDRVYDKVGVLTFHLQPMFDKLDKEVKSVSSLEYVVWALMKHLELLTLECERLLLLVTTTPKHAQQNDKSDNGQKKENAK
jgi:hypothetical protein